jgi:DNA repair ATPase RecN
VVDTFDYEDLRSAIDKIRAKTARFHRVDLHCHTIDSGDFPSVHGKLGFVDAIPSDEMGLRGDPDEFKRRFVEQAKGKGLRLVAVTDHNEADMAAQLSLMSDSELTILPGVEISVQTNQFPDSVVHILGIFPQSTSAKQIDKVFPAGCGMPESGKREGGRTNFSIPEIIKTIHKLNGIAIAAHVSSKDGVRTMVLSQNVDWLQKNYLRRYLKGRCSRTREEDELLGKLQQELKPIDDEVQNTYLNFLFDQDFDAIQIQDVMHGQYYSGRHMEAIALVPLACVLSSDAHTLADLGCRGHGTHIKMAEVNLDGLRKAFRDPGTRVRYDATVPSEKPKRILGITFNGGSFDKEVIAFADNLTALIGGRGTGKSALIEALRFVLNQPVDTLPDRLRKDIEDRREFTLRDTEVKILFADEHMDELFVLKRRFDESKTSCYSLDGKLLPEIQLPASQRVRAEIYGWSEIEELSDSPRKQMALLDRAVPDIENLRLGVRTCFENLRLNGEEIIALARKIWGLLPQIEGAEEIRQQLASLSTPALNAAFAKYDQNDGALRALRNLMEEAKASRSWLLDKTQKRDFVQVWTESIKGARGYLESYDWQSRFLNALGESVRELQKHYDHMLVILEAVSEDIALRIAELDKERNTIISELNSLAEQSGENDFKAALARREDLTNNLSKIKGFEEEIEKHRLQIALLFGIRRNQIVPALDKSRGTLYKAREAKAKATADRLLGLKAASGITINTECLGSTSDFSRALGYREANKTEGLLKGIDKHYLVKDYPGFYARRFTPHTFVELLLGDVGDCHPLNIRFIRRRTEQKGEIVRVVEGSVEEKGQEIVEIASDGKTLGTWSSADFECVAVDAARKVWEHLSPKFNDGEIGQYYHPERLKTLLELELVEIDDLPVIRLDGKPIEELSPGQRCSALIPIVLVEGRIPLVIDQPEDNLDNKMVFDLVVDILRGLKEHRQIIVATHNPNIPVSGDAEQVVVFESPRKDKCCACEQGSIDNEDIVRHIKTVMEGGDKAFEMRMRKYNLLESR